MRTASEMLKRARAGLILDQPFFGALALRMELIEDTTIETMGTDGREIRYNPEFVDSLPPDQLKGVVAHEVMHPACAHHVRRGGRDPVRWNVASDYAINPILKDAGFVLPDSALNDPAFAGRSADEIYNLLPESDDGQGAADPGGCGAVTDAPGDDGGKASASEMRQQENDWKVAVSQAAQQARAMGKLPAGAARLVDELTNPPLDWREMLWRFVQQNARDDYRWFPPNRRFIHAGIYLPGMRSESMPPFVFAVDTSASMPQAAVGQVAAEFTAILELYQTTIYAVYADAKVANVQEFTRDNLPVKLDARGGGGTDFRPVFDWVEKQGIRPACLVYLTDTWGTFPDVAPDYDVLWLITSGADADRVPFGDSCPVNV